MTFGMNAVIAASVCAVVVAVAVGCGGGSGGGKPPESAALNCNDELRNALITDTHTTVLRIEEFKKGEQLVLSGGADASTPTAGADLCFVKLLVGPGNPGPVDAPSTSAGIGIEVWLPSHGNWNERIRVYGNGGWSGTEQGNPTVITFNYATPGHLAAASKGYVVASSDNGHSSAATQADPSFAMNPDGSINEVLWKDFSERSLHVLAEKTKAAAKAYYGKTHKFAYWDGYSTGGRQALKLAQVFPDDFDGILAGAPAIHWTRYHTAALYPQIVMKQDLGGNMAFEKLTAVSQAALNACGGEELGFVIDPLSCRYDPTADAAILCAGAAGSGGVVGTNGLGSCLNLAEANAVNKFWYGQTGDGSVPSPSQDNGDSNVVSGQRVWFGWTRGTDLTNIPTGFAPILGADMVALELQDVRNGSFFFTNATGNGSDLWRTTFDYSALADAQLKGLALQPQFSHINTDNPDLSAFQNRGGKLLMYHGLADDLIPVQGSISYYENVASQMGGINAIQSFSRFYLIPGFGHVEPVSGKPYVPLPQSATGRDEMFMALQNWVEKGDAPKHLVVTSSDETASLPLCVYPRKITFSGAGSVKAAASYACQ